MLDTRVCAWLPHTAIATHWTERVMKPMEPVAAEHETEHAENGETTDW